MIAREKADDVSKRVLETLKSKDLSPTDSNYTLWFQYYLGQNKDLKQQIDDHLSAEEKITEEIQQALYDIHVSAAMDEVLAASDTIDDVLSDITSLVGGANNDVARFGNSLQSASSALGKGGDSVAIDTIVKKLTSETKAMQAKVKALETDLESKNSEVQTLQSDLQKVREEAWTDGLTGIANRKKLEATFEKHLKGFQKDKKPLAVLMIDIDFFKKFNDTYGHQLGDQVLRLVARSLTECVRSDDLAARYGGEEFTVIMPGADMAASKEVAERIRTTVQGRKLVRRGSKQAIGGITLSIGVGQVNASDTFQTVLERADKALYYCKKNGRNRVTYETEMK